MNNELDEAQKLLDEQDSKLAEQDKLIQDLNEEVRSKDALEA